MGAIGPQRQQLNLPQVVEISMALDKKINEYMNRQRGSRS
ncbi:aspartyl-phosphate phosphatase Spo0E family protein [Paenibacillus sp. P26]|nr:aspartyl-phosphate phosphatase Spo0E family protein [Paenibacillus sp. P26]